MLVQPLSVPKPTGREPHHEASMQLFEGAGGLLGASGPSLSCRRENVWSKLLARSNATLFALDFQPPPQAFRAAGFNALANIPDESQITLGQVDPRYEEDLVWSQPKQTGDLINDAMSEFLVYHPTVCGVDLLYNTSSNWLTVLDTSGPCLLLPPFLFDRLRKHVPMTCPFAEEEQALGRLCSPRRGDAGPQGGPLLPAMHFQLEDDRDAAPGIAPPRKLQMPLERLVFKNASGHELLCISRDDGARAGADMLFSHISFGSLAVAALYTAVDLQTNRVGLAVKGNASTESTDRFCSARAICKSPMQTYYPPLNVCEDPVCSKYLFMTLDDETKTCIWYRSVPALFGVLLAALVTLDLLGHRLYSQATEKAAGLRPRQ
uniref:Peptidase A1 domain-containing protein n=1 Tax=Alexandrium catenella TaxID=2925 RepID=A0A7S1R2D8_ALECA